jgi:TonB family protein
LKYKLEIISGIAAAAVLLLLLGASRLLVSAVDAPGLTVREIDRVSDPAPPPPPPPTEENEPPPPAPLPTVALEDVEALPDMSRIPVAKAEVPMDVSLPVDLFSADIAPAPLPRTGPALRRMAARPGLPQPKPPPAKSVYSVGDLDSKPRLISYPSVSFPSALARRGVRRGTVVLEVEIDTRGRVRVRSVVSSTHPELVAKARKIADGAQFTPPRHRGRPVRAVMRWPIVIRR